MKENIKNQRKNIPILQSLPIYFSELLSRLSILYLWVSKKNARKRVNFMNLWKQVFTPPSLLVVKRFFSYSREDYNFVYYKIRGIDALFIYSKALPYYGLACIIYETFHKDGWHYYEISQTKVREGDVVVDCGASEGLFAFKNKDIAKKLYLIEPLPIFIYSLQKLFHRQNNVIIIEAAASDRIGELYLLPETWWGSTCLTDAVNKDCIRIKCVTIDSLFFDKGIYIDYLKADLEGHEDKMLLGALKTIKMSKPKIAIAVYHQGQDYQSTINLIQKVVPEYKYLIKGIGGRNGGPVILHMWV